MFVSERGEQGRSKVAERRKDSDKAYRELVRQVTFASKREQWSSLQLPSVSKVGETNALEIAFAIGQLQGQPEDDPFTPFINFMLGLIDRYKREILNRWSSERRSQACLDYPESRQRKTKSTARSPTRRKP